MKNCRFPDCLQPTTYCDVDNPQTLHWHHHRVKHETVWAITMTTDGICFWIGSTDRDYVINSVSFSITSRVGDDAGPDLTFPRRV